MSGVPRGDRNGIQAAERKRREQDWAAWGRLKLRHACAGGTTFNKSLSCLQAILDIGIERGAR